MMAGKIWYGAMAFGCLAWSQAIGGVLFSDDFSNANQTNLNWITPYTTLTRTCANGVYTLSNASSDAAFVTASLTSKPVVLTVTGKMTRSAEDISAGILFCFNATNITGYLIHLNPVQGIQLSKYVNGNQSTLYNDRSAAVVQGTNELTISRKNDSISIFCNGSFITILRDANPVAGGDVGLLVPGKKNVVFDDIVVTDEWTPVPAPAACFRDDFLLSNNLWLDYGNGDSKQVAEGVLKLTTTANNSYSDYYVRVDHYKLDTFVVSAAFSHRSGDKTNMYGIFFCGAVVQQVVPMVYFCINGLRQYDAYADTIRPITNSAIRGAAFEGTYYTDTIMVVKKRNAPYRMYVNGQLLDSLPASRVSFSIVGAGINVDNGMVVWSDYFQYGSGEICPVMTPAKVRKGLSYAGFAPYRSDFLFDPMGRIIRTKNGIGVRGTMILVPGCYIMPSGKKGIVLKP
jgi:hypothetical protein